MNVTEAQCGHFRRRRYMSTRWHEMNAHAQCNSCNTVHDGAEDRHREYIDRVYGEGTADELTVLSHQIAKFHNWELKEMRDKLRDKVRARQKELGLKIW